MTINSQKNKEKILNNFLKSCPDLGWGDNALSQAFIDSKIEEKFLWVIFDEPLLDLADLFIEKINQEMAAKAAKINLDEMRVSQKIRELVITRLEINKNYRQQIKQLATFYKNSRKLYQKKSLNSAKNALTNSYKVADLMWKMAGDKSTDYNFYTKRFILGKIYLRVMAVFINDNSENLDKTIKILDSELAKVARFAKAKAATKESLSQIGDLLGNFNNSKKEFCQKLKSNPKSFLKKLPFFRLYD